MSISANIKRLRTERSLTQEQLAEALSVTAQAVSKWETSETYPDGALLVPLAQALGVSLDVLFGNDFISMADISHRIVSLMHKTDEADRFAVGREIAWQIERGLFHCFKPLDPYSPEDINTHITSSTMLGDDGFTVIANGSEPFFSIFSEPDEGWGAFLKRRNDLQGLFAALSHPSTLDALLFLYHKPKGYLLDAETLAKKAAIPSDAMDATLENLIFLRAIEKKEFVINGERRALYESYSPHKLFGLLLFAKEVRYCGPHCLTAYRRTKPFFGEKDIRRNKNDEANDQ